MYTYVIISLFDIFIKEKANKINNIKLIYIYIYIYMYVKKNVIIKIKYINI